MKRLMTIFTVFLLVFACVLPSMACVVCDERVDGNATIAVFTSHGDQNTGGVSFGNADSGFSAAGHNFAFGNAQAQGTVLGDIFKAQDFAFSSSISDVRSNALAFGNCFSVVEASGLAQQANWALVGDGLNGAAGENYSQGMYEGRVSRWGFVGLSGGAHADGFTSVFTFSTPTSRQSGGITQNNGSAWIQGFGGDPSVLGYGHLITQSYLTSGSRTGWAFGAGNASYSANGPRWANGSLSISGSTSVNFLPNGISASSNISSTSSANSH